MKKYFTIILLTFFVNCSAQKTITLQSGKTISCNPLFKTPQDLFVRDSIGTEYKIPLSMISTQKTFCPSYKNISAGQDLKCSANNLQGGWLALFIGSGMNVFGTIIDNKAPEETPLWYYGIWSGVSLSGIYMIIRSGSFTRRAGIKMDAKLLQ